MRASSMTVSKPPPPIPPMRPAPRKEPTEAPRKTPRCRWANCSALLGFHETRATEIFEDFLRCVAPRTDHVAVLGACCCSTRNPAATNRNRPTRSASSGRHFVAMLDGLETSTCALAVRPLSALPPPYADRQGLGGGYARQGILVATKHEARLNELAGPRQPHRAAESGARSPGSFSGFRLLDHPSRRRVKEARLLRDEGGMGDIGDLQHAGSSSLRNASPLSL